MNRKLLSILSPFIGILLMATIIFYYAGLNLGLQEIGFAILFPGTFALTLVIDKASSIYRKQETILYLLFLLLAIVSVLFIDFDFEKFNFTFFKILAAFMGAYIGIALCNKVDLENYFHIGFIVSLLIIIYFEYSFGTFNPATFYAPTASRGDFSHNANYYSYMSLFANFSIFRLHLRHKNIWTILGLILIPLLGLAISFTVQTRSGLLFILLINALFWFWVYKPKKKNPAFSILRKLLLLTLALVFLFQFFNFYTNSSIQDRVSSTSTEDSRGHLAKEGFEIFLNYPLTGVGTGNFTKYSSTRAFSHNTYIEALAEHGLFMGSLIIFVFILPFFKSFRLFSSNKSNPEYKLNLLFFSTFLLYMNIYVFYQASYAMMYFFLMLGIHYKLLETKKYE